MDMDKHVGMYIHMHWSYKHPYAARTWKFSDWSGYLSGLSDLGYNTVMIWPMLETIPDDPTFSDIKHLELIQRIIHAAKSRFGMETLITMGPNTVANEHASDYAFEDRPFFKTTQRLDPKNSADMDRLFAVRKMQMQYLSDADGIVVIDSDPGGYIGSTNEEYVQLLERYMDVSSKFNKSARLYYWMWFGWETYNRMWEAVQQGNPASLRMNAEDFEDVLSGLKESQNDNWALMSCFPIHQEIINKLGLQDRSMFYPYGLIEGEPTFPLTSWNLDKIAEAFKRYDPAQMPLGVMGNAQTHAVQLPNTFAFAKAAGCSCLKCDRLDEFANALIPGEGHLIAQAWEALQGEDYAEMYALSRMLKDKTFKQMDSGPAVGLLLMTPQEFMEDLAFQLEFKADIVDFRKAIAEQRDAKKEARILIKSWRRWQNKTGFADAYGNLQDLNQTLRQLNDPEINAVFADFDDWRNPENRHGVVLRLLNAFEKWAAE